MQQMIDDSVRQNVPEENTYKYVSKICFLVLLVQLIHVALVLGVVLFYYVALYHAHITLAVCDVLFVDLSLRLIVLCLKSLIINFVLEPLPQCSELVIKDTILLLQEGDRVVYPVQGVVVLLDLTD